MEHRALVIDAIYSVADRQEVLAHLSSFDWDFSPGDVTVRCGKEELLARQVGSGNHEGRAVVVLHPLDSWAKAALFVQRSHQRRSGRLTIERPTSGER